MNIQTWLSQTAAAPEQAPAPPPARARAANDTTPINLKVRISTRHDAELHARATARGVSVATVVREILDGAL